MSLDINEIMAIIPHRYPFLLVDRIEEIVSGERIVGLKNVTVNEPFFAGHFPQQPVMPGVLILEAIAQVGAVMILKDLPDRARKLVYFVAIEDAKFRRPVVPGDQLRLEVTAQSMRTKFGKMRGEATVAGKIAAEAVVTYAIVDRDGPDPSQ
ncbi:MAG: 3-hydroxyacyl-ACP dehydratase FabZ [Acidobacteriia bacterium]|nr:3-hydroxyacyl-ACP dehydratase FabZ [Terriglobia bacterium]